MCTATSTEENRSPEIAPSVLPQAPWRLSAIAAHSEFRLHVLFNDGTEGDVEMADLIHSPEAGVFATLRDEAIFQQVHLEWGVATWPGEIDLAPDAMYEAIRQQGTWALS